MTEFTRSLKIFGGYDGRSHPRNYGIHSCDLFFVLTGPLGAITVEFGTAWYTPGEPQQNSLTAYVRGYPYDPLKELMQPRGRIVAYHAHAPQYEGQELSCDHCEWLSGPCYSDCSFSYADSWAPVLLHEGSDGIFLRMEQEYAHRFLSGPAPDLTPKPREFPS